MQKKSAQKIKIFWAFKEAQTGFEPVNTGVADHCLTTWLLRHFHFYYMKILAKYARFPNDSDGNRTRVTAVKGRCLNRLTTEPQFLKKLPQLDSNQRHCG